MNKPAAASPIHRTGLRATACLAAGLLGFAGTCLAQQAVDMQALIQETQKLSIVRKEGVSQDMTMVWWIPLEFWVESAKQSPGVTQEAIAKIRSALASHTIVAVMSGHSGPQGVMTYDPTEAVRAGVILKDAHEASYAVLPDEKVSSETKKVLALIKPVIANMIGPMGQNMNFFCFEAKSSDGQLIADARGDRPFSVVVNGQPYRFRVPLGSLLPPKFDAQTREVFPGNYLYSPYTGTKLVVGPPATAPASAPAATGDSSSH